MKIFLPNGIPHEVPPESPPPAVEGGTPQPYDYKNEAIEVAVKCWQDKETQGIPMEGRLASAFARRLAGWMKIAADGWQGAEIYRGIIDQCGAAIGIEAYTSDDGSIQEDVLALKLPELVKKLVLDNRPEPDPLPQVEQPAPSTRL